MYSVKGLTEGIKHCRKNIKVLKDAIAKEQNTIKEYKVMIDSIETAEKRAQEAKAGINIEVA